MLLAHLEAYCVIFRDFEICFEENTSWLFIDKIVIIVCNRLNLQGNRLIQ